MLLKDGYIEIHSNRFLARVWPPSAGVPSKSKYAKQPMGR